MMMYKALRCADDLMLLFVVAFQFHSIRCNCATSFRTLVPRNRKKNPDYLYTPPLQWIRILIQALREMECISQWFSLSCNFAGVARRVQPLG